MAISSPETANKTPNKYPGVFNTVIPFDNFYLQIGQNRLTSKDIIGMWRYVHNLFVEVLTKLGLIDKFGRVKNPALDTLAALYEEYWKGDLLRITLLPDFHTKPLYLNRLARAILHGIILDLSTESVEWIRIYPIEMLIMPILQDLHEIMSASTVTRLQMISGHRGNIGPFELRLQYMERFYALHIDYDVKSQRNMISFTLLNQYGREVHLLIKSNTKNFDNLINMIDDRIRIYQAHGAIELFLNSFIFIFGISKEASRKRKLLLSVVSCDPHTDLNETSREE